MAATIPPKITKQGGRISLATCPARNAHGESAAAGKQQDFYTCMLKLIFTCTVKTILLRHVMHCTCGGRSTSPSGAGHDHGRKPSPWSQGRQGGCCPLGKVALLIQTLARETKRSPARLCRALPPLPDTETAYDKHPRSTHQPQAMRELETFVTILEDGTSLKNKHALFKWIRRTLQLNDCLISETGVTAARTLLLSQAALSTVITPDC